MIEKGEPKKLSLNFSVRRKCIIFAALITFFDLLQLDNRLVKTVKSIVYNVNIKCLLIIFSHKPCIPFMLLFHVSSLLPQDYA